MAKFHYAKSVQAGVVEFLPMLLVSCDPFGFFYSI